ncbi:MAG: SPFH domain-containing protein [Puia sp.]
MTLIILGLLVLMLGFVARRLTSPISHYSGYLRITGFVLFLVGLISSCIVQNWNRRSRCSDIIRKCTEYHAGRGLHFINPLLDVQKLDIKTQNYTMSAIHNEGTKEGDDAIRVLTSDGLEVVMDLTVLYKVVPSSAPDILRSTGIDYTDKIVTTANNAR